MLTEMKTVLSMETRGMISIGCWVAMSSSSGGVVDVLREVGRAICGCSERSLMIGVAVPIVELRHKLSFGVSFFS